MKATRDDDPAPLEALNRDFIEGYASGYLEGLERGRRQAEAEMATRWAHVAHTVHAMAKVEPWTAHERARKARQEAARAANHAAAKPWPDEVDS